MVEISTLAAENFPRSYQFKQWLRSREISVQNLITEMGDILGRGREVIYGSGLSPKRAPSTGSDLCVLMATIAEQTLPKRFEDIDISIECGIISTFDADPEDTSKVFSFDHAWNPFQFPDEPPCFLDSAFGQANPWLNRIVVDTTENQLYYYHELVNYGQLPTSTIYKSLRECHKTSNRLLTEKDKRKLRRLAFQTAKLLSS